MYFYFFIKVIEIGKLGFICKKCVCVCVVCVGVGKVYKYKGVYGKEIKFGVVVLFR